MEMLDALERRVTELLDETRALRKRNAELEALNSAPARVEEGENPQIARLEEALRQEQTLREAVLKRVSTLVRHLEEHNGAS